MPATLSRQGIRKRTHRPLKKSPIKKTLDPAQEQSTGYIARDVVMNLGDSLKTTTEWQTCTSTNISRQIAENKVRINISKLLCDYSCFSSTQGYSDTIHLFFDLFESNEPLLLGQVGLYHLIEQLLEKGNNDPTSLKMAKNLLKRDNKTTIRVHTPLSTSPEDFVAKMLKIANSTDDQTMAKAESHQLLQAFQTLYTTLNERLEQGCKEFRSPSYSLLGLWETLSKDPELITLYKAFTQAWTDFTKMMFDCVIQQATESERS